MKTNHLIRSLSQINWIVSVIIGCIVATFVFTYVGFTKEAVFVAVVSTLNILVISFLNIGIFVIVGKYRPAWSGRQKRVSRFIIAYIITVIYSLVTRPLRDLFADETWKTTTLSQQVITVISGSLLLNLVILSMHNFVILYHSRNAIEVENAELKVANAEANNLLLKQQIHPHFLFNALNILKSLYRKDPGAGDKYIVHLANFLRASFANTSARVVSLEEEIHLCTDYIAMQKIRFGDALQYQNDIPPDTNANGYLPFFSLQPLLENAIKHNDITDEKPLKIRMYKENEEIVVENNLQKKKSSGTSTGSGLINLIKRYKLLSGDEVVINEDADKFSVRLKILSA